MDHRLTALIARRITEQTRLIIFTMVGVLIPYAGVIFAAARFA